MSNRFDKREAVFAAANAAFKERWKALTSCFGRVQMAHKTVQRTVVVINQLAHARGQSGKGQFMPPKNKLILGCKGAQPLAGLKPVRDWIGLWLRGINPDIGTDRRQNLVAGNHEIVIARPKRNVLGRMPVADMHIPIAPTDPNHIILFDALEPQRHRVDDVSKIERALSLALVEDLFIHARRLVKAQRFLRGHRLFIKLQHTREKPGSPTGPELGLMFGLKPARKPHMVRVVMGDDYPAHGFPAQGAVQ